MVLDTIIIGAGAMGSSASYWLSKYQDVALIEQYPLLHTQGSSHGQSRVIRRTYREQYFAEMMKESYGLWEQIQRETQTSVYQRVGGLDVGKEGNQDINTTLKTAETIGMDYEVLDAKELTTRYPAYKVDDDYIAIYQAETGILNANKAVDMFQRQAANQGAQIIAQNPVKSIHLHHNKVIVDTVKGSYEAKNLVITAGSWMNKILQQFNLILDVEIWKLTFAYWKVTKPDLFQPDKFPVFIHWDDNIDYGFPISERDDYIKIAPHVNTKIAKGIPYNDEINPVNNELLNHISDFIGSSFVGIDPEPAFPETCLYTMTKDENFILDYLPKRDNVVVAGGFSGHGFKFTPLIGKIIQQMIMDQECKTDLTHFKIQKFLK